jgi:glycosyltransferase involved in cell wall biosynthesis
VDFKRFKYSEPPTSSEFRLLFASSPNVEEPYKNNFEAKGVPLLLEAFCDFVQNEPAHLYILWRGKYDQKLNDKIRELDLNGKITVVKGIVEPYEWYRKTHVTVIPYTSTWRSAQIPLSALESLVSGRPVVTTDILELANMINEYRCGCVCQTRKDSLFSALQDCKKRYLEYQRNCQKVAEVLYARQQYFLNLVMGFFQGRID